MDSGRIYSLIASQCSISKYTMTVIVILLDARCPTSFSLHHLVDALCSMPNLTEQTVTGKDFKEEFNFTLNAKASTLQVCMCLCTLYPCHDKCIFVYSNGDEF